MAIEQLLSLLLRTEGHGSRSTALQPLLWLILALGILLLGGAHYSLPVLVMQAAAILLVLTVVTFLGSYIYLIVTNVDATRSEKFVLKKMELKQSRIGDDQAGFDHPSMVLAETKQQTISLPSGGGL